MTFDNANYWYVTINEREDGTKKIGLNRTGNYKITKFLSSESYAYGALYNDSADRTHSYTFSNDELKFDTITIRYGNSGVLKIHGIYYRKTNLSIKEGLTTYKGDKFVYVDNGTFLDSGKRNDEMKKLI